MTKVSYQTGPSVGFVGEMSNILSHWTRDIDECNFVSQFGLKRSL